MVNFCGRGGPWVLRLPWSWVGSRWACRGTRPAVAGTGPRHVLSPESMAADTDGRNGLRTGVHQLLARSGRPRGSGRARYPPGTMPTAVIEPVDVVCQNGRPDQRLPPAAEARNARTTGF